MGQRLPATLLSHFKTWQPRTPGLANKRLVRVDDLFQGPPIASLLVPLHKTGGRCRITGRITTRHRGGGEKHDYRLIDWDRRLSGKHQVMRVEADPNRTARIALLKHIETSRLSYIVAPKGLEVGNVVQSGVNVPPDRGNCLPLSSMPPGTLVHNIGLKTNQGGKIARAAGTYGQLLRTGQQGFAQVKMCSGEVRFIPVGALATVGVVSNQFHKLEQLGTAGANRRKGIRPSVRGIAMNPVDHPMGGRGRRRGMPSTSPWGKITKGGFTVKKHLQPYVIKARPSINRRKKQVIRRVGKYALQDEMLFKDAQPQNDGPN